MPFGDLGQRLEMGPDGRDLRQRLEDRLLDVLGDAVSLVQRQRAGQLEVERDLPAPVDVDHVHVVDLADPGHLEHGRVDPLAQRGLRAGLRLDVDDDVRLRERPAHGILDVVGRSVALCDGGAGRHGDDDVDEVATGGLAKAEPAEADARARCARSPAARPRSPPQARGP